jgi:hypothetical protein
VNELKVEIRDVLEIDDAGTTSCPTRQGGATPEPAITMTVDEIHAAHGTRPLTAEEFEELFGDLPSDGQG